MHCIYNTRRCANLRRNSGLGLVEMHFNLEYFNYDLPTISFTVYCKLYPKQSDRDTTKYTVDCHTHDLQYMPHWGSFYSSSKYVGKEIE